MANKKNIRTKGKIQFSSYFQELNKGENVSVIIEKGLSSSFPKRLQGRTGRVKEKRGRAYLVEIADQNKPKTFIIAPIHLKKINS